VVFGDCAQSCFSEVKNVLDDTEGMLDFGANLRLFALDFLVLVGDDFAALAVDFKLDFLGN